MKKRYEILAFVLFAMAVFLSVFKLTESPPTWMDEGIIINTARVFSETGQVGIQVAPATYESAGVVTTSFPVVAPVALVFDIFGVSLLGARSVMVLYIVFLFAFSYVLLRKYTKDIWLLLAFALVVSFPPLYGHGKNVLGEIPGMFFFIAFLLLLWRIRLTPHKPLYYFLAGLCSGLAVVTKPIFLLLIPGLVLAMLVEKYEKRDLAHDFHKRAVLAVLGFVMIFTLWLSFQFSGDTLSHIFNVYANPGKVNIWQTVLSNIKLYFSESQPIYFILLMAVWFISLYMRLKKKIPTTFAEKTAFFFSVLVALAFLRVPPYYRYFFPAQFLAIIFFIPSLQYIKNSFSGFDRKQVFSPILLILLFLLFAYQSYSLFFSSWTAQAYTSRQTRTLVDYFQENKDHSYFFYETPELATFVIGEQYYQYMNVAPTLSVGSTSLVYLQKGLPDRVIVHDDVSFDKETFAKYSVIDHVARYNILAKKNEK